MTKSRSISKIAFILLLTAIFFGITFRMYGGSNNHKTGAYLTDQGGIIGIIQLGGEQLKVTQALNLGDEPVETEKIIFNRDYFATDMTYSYDVRLKNAEKEGGSDSKYLRWKWTAKIDGVEENINEYVNTTDTSETTNKQAYLVEGWYYLVDNDYVGAKLAPQESIPILERLNFKGKYDTSASKYGSVLDKYVSGSKIEIYLTVQGSTDDEESDGVDDDRWEIVTPQAVIYDHEGNSLVRTEEFGGYTIPNDLGISKSIDHEDTTLYFQGFQITNEETGNEGGSIFYPGDTIILSKFDRLIPVYGQEDYSNTLVFSMDESTGTYMIKGINGGSSSGGNSTITTVNIPTLVAGNVITTIQDLGFFKYIKLETVTLGQKVTTIGYGAFGYCTSLNSITLPDSVTTIGDNAFYGCTSLESIDIPNSVTSIGNYAFAESGLISITIPDGVKSIGAGTFGMCSNIRSVMLPNSVTTIGVQAFFGCKNLQSINLPSSIENIGDFAFQGCTGLQELTIPGSLTTLGQQIFRESGLRTVIVQKGVSVISVGMFYQCTNLNYVELAESIITIGDSAFFGCTSLATITIPSAVKTIRPYAFKECSSLSNVSFGNKAGWSAGSTPIATANLEDTTIAARYLKETYNNVAWTRS